MHETTTTELHHTNIVLVWPNPKVEICYSGMNLRCVSSAKA